MLCNGAKRPPIGLAKNWNPVGNTLDSYTGNIYLSLKNHEFNRLLPPATKLGQGNIFTGICDSVHSGGLPQCMLGYHHLPPSRTRQAPPPPKDQAGTPPYPPPGPGRHPPPQAEHIGRYGQRAGGLHPTGMQSCSL